jgi:hypothetical protein
LNLSSLTKDQEKEKKDMEEQIQQIVIHQNNAKKQRESFKEHIANLQEDPKEVVILFDFKENLKCGSCPNETNTDFYEKFPISCFGLIVFHLKDIYIFDYLSKDLVHDGHFASSCLSNLFENAEFKKLNATKVSIWSDGASHFKNHEMTACYDSFQSRFEKFQWNFFIQYHGKNYCDSHFSVISRIIKRFENNEGKIDSLEKLCDVLEKKFQSIKNHYKLDSSRKKIYHRFQNAKISILPFIVPPREDLKPQIKIPGIKQYFSFQFNSNKICTKYLTSNLAFKKFPKKKTFKKRETESNHSSETNNNSPRKRKTDESISIEENAENQPENKIQKVDHITELLNFIDEELIHATHSNVNDPMEIDS